MKLLIADDMEGISGVVSWNHCDSTHYEYNRFRRIMTDEVNAAIQGAFEGGADEIVVADGHGGAKNIMAEFLDKRVRLNSGTPSKYAMVNGVEDNVDAMMYVGYHARVGTPCGVLAHTWSLAIYNVWVNDLLVGEIGLNALLAGHFGVPLLMISSDLAGCKEAEALVPGVKTVPVKVGTSMYAADCLPNEIAQAQIKETALQAVKEFKAGKKPAPLTTTTPVTLTVELAGSQMGDAVLPIPGIIRLEGRTVQIEVPDMPTAYGAFRTIASMARSA